MTTYLTVNDGLKRSLGYIDEDDSLDQELLDRMSSLLKTAELYVQGAIGSEIPGFYMSEGIKPLYTLACNTLAATFFQSPTSTTTGAVTGVDAVSKSIIGQLRGKYDEVLENGQDTESKSQNTEN